jgi:predicted PilT family ATPase
MLKIVKSRQYTVEHIDAENDVSFSITFKFKPSEDNEIKRIRTEVEAKRGEVEQNSDLIDVLIREAIVDCHDIFNEEDMTPIKVADDKGVPDPYIQKLLFDIAKSYPDFFLKVIMAFLGPKGKNLKTGQTALSSGSGDQASAPSVPNAPVTPVPAI